MLDLTDVFYFVQVVDHGGFTAAGRVLRLPKTTLSHRVQQLEGSLNVRLLHRTSRRLSLTDVGSEFYGHALSMLREADAAENVARRRLAEPSGTIRMTSSAAIAQFALRDLLPAFLERFPKVSVVQHASDVMVDIVGEGFDLALRAHSAPLPSSTLVQRTLAPIPWFLFAGTAYLGRRGEPGTPGDLAGHSAIALGRDSAQTWQLRSMTDEPAIVAIEPRFVSNDMVALKRAACAGLGIVALPGYVCRAEVEAGEMKRVLPDWRAADSVLSALVPFRHGGLPSVRALVDFLAAELPGTVNA